MPTKPLTNDEILRRQIAGSFMLATEIRDPSRNALFSLPLLGQPKLNGLRARYVRKERAFYSRDGVRYANATTAHIQPPNDLPFDLDGEFYVHGWSLQRINSAITPNRLTPTADTPHIGFHVFDVFAPMPAVQRARFVSNLPKAPGLNVVQTRDLYSRAQVEEHYLAVTSELYEGAIYRWPSSTYVPGRSNFLLKRKAWVDGEFEVVGYEEGEGRLKETLGAFVCACPGGRGTFNVGGGITDPDRVEFWDKRIENIGRLVKVKYLGLSDDGAPIHPQFLALL